MKSLLVSLAVFAGVAAYVFACMSIADALGLTEKEGIALCSGTALLLLGLLSQNPRVNRRAAETDDAVVGLLVTATGVITLVGTAVHALFFR